MDELVHIFELEERQRNDLGRLLSDEFGAFFVDFMPGASKVKHFLYVLYFLTFCTFCTFRLTIERNTQDRALSLPLQEDFIGHWACCALQAFADTAKTMRLEYVFVHVSLA